MSGHEPLESLIFQDLGSQTGELISDAALRHLLASGLCPLLDFGKGQNRFAIGFANAIVAMGGEIGPVCAKARDDWREHGVGGAKFTEQKWAARAIGCAAHAPQRNNPGDIAAYALAHPGRRRRLKNPCYTWCQRWLPCLCTHYVHNAPWVHIHGSYSGPYSEV